MNDEFDKQPISMGTFTGLLNKEYDAEAFVKAMDHPDAVFSREESRMIKDFGGTTTAVVILDLGKGREPFVLKRFNPEGFMNRVFRRFRKSRASRVWSMSIKLLAHEVSVPKPVAMIEEKRGGTVGKSYFLSGFSDDAINLKAHSVQSGTDILNDGRLLKRIGNLIGRMHGAGFIHGDLKWSNILFLDRSGELEPLLVDLDHVHHHLGISDGRRARDLARFMADVRELNIAPGLSEHFLEFYFSSLEIESSRKKKFTAKLEHGIQKIMLRHEQNKEDVC